MKTRTGFVSNSSSSSFCIYGICMNEESIMEDLKLEGELGNDIAYDFLCKNLPKGWTVTWGPECEEMYIGRNWISVKDDETGLEFKESIKFILEELFGKKINCRTHEEAWMNN